MDRSQPFSQQQQQAPPLASHQQALANKRREKDISKLLVSEFEVTLPSPSTAKQINKGYSNEFFVKLKGPLNSLYEGGVWIVRVLLPDQYPYKSPSIGFVNKIYHPNIDEASGSVCLDVINQTWSPMFDLVNIFDVFLPQLLLYPNAKDPLNGDAAQKYMHDEAKYKEIVRDFVKQYATEEYIKQFDLGKEETKEEEDFDFVNGGKSLNTALAVARDKNKDDSASELSETSQLDCNDDSWCDQSPSLVLLDASLDKQQLAADEEEDKESQQQTEEKIQEKIISKAE